MSLPSLGPPFQQSHSTLTFQFPVTLSPQTRVIISSHIRLFKFIWETPNKNTLKDEMWHLDIRCLFLLAPRFGRSQPSKYPSWVTRGGGLLSDSVSWNNPFPPQLVFGEGVYHSNKNRTNMEIGARIMDHCCDRHERVVLGRTVRVELWAGDDTE